MTVNPNTHGNMTFDQYINMIYPSYSSWVERKTSLNLHGGFSIKELDGQFSAELKRYVDYCEKHGIKPEDIEKLKKTL